MIIYYNPECSKCKRAVEILEKNKCGFELRNYLSSPPSVHELKDLCRLLRCRAIDIVRKGEPLYIGKYEGKNMSEEELFDTLSANPILIERPIVIDGKRAMIGRPPELIVEFVGIELL